MKIVKNMEAVFVVAVALVAATAFATDFTTTATATKQAAVATDGEIATVVITGKRMTDAEKARSGS